MVHGRRMTLVCIRAALDACLLSLLNTSVVGGGVAHHVRAHHVWTREDISVILFLCNSMNKTMKF